MIAFIQNISATQLIAILLIILLLFGAKRLPELARSFGKSLREFKNATKDIEKDFRSAMDEDEAPKSASREAPKAEHARPEAPFPPEDAPQGPIEHPEDQKVREDKDKAENQNRS